MKFLKQMDRYRKLDKLIKQEKTGTPKELADKLRISRSHVYRTINRIRRFGAVISYSRKRTTFYYNKPFNLSAFEVQSDD